MCHEPWEKMEYFQQENAQNTGVRHKADIRQIRRHQAKVRWCPRVSGNGHKVCKTQDSSNVYETSHWRGNWRFHGRCIKSMHYTGRKNTFWCGHTPTPLNAKQSKHSPWFTTIIPDYHQEFNPNYEEFGCILWPSEDWCMVHWQKQMTPSSWTDCSLWSKLLIRFD